MDGHEPSRARSPMLEILRCADCGCLAVALNDQRITNHKCSGWWNIVQRMDFDVDSVRAAIESKEGR